MMDFIQIFLSSELYRDQTDSLSGNKNRNLDYFGFENKKGLKKISIQKKIKRYF